MESELAEREKFGSEMTETLAWLEQAQAVLQTDKPVEMSQIKCQLEQQQALKQDVDVKVAGARQAVQQQQDRYADVCELPEHLTQYCHQLDTLQTDLALTFEQKTKELHEAKGRSHEYETTVQQVRQWLEQAETSVDDKIHDLQNAKDKHKVSSSFYFDIFTPDSLVTLTFLHHHCTTTDNRKVSHPLIKWLPVKSKHQVCTCSASFNNCRVFPVCATPLTIIVG